MIWQNQGLVANCPQLFPERYVKQIIVSLIIIYITIGSLLFATINTQLVIHENIIQFG